MRTDRPIGEYESALFVVVQVARLNALPTRLG